MRVPNLEEASSVLPSPKCPLLCMWPKHPGSGCRGYVVGSRSNERTETRMDALARTCLPMHNMFWGVKRGGLGAFATGGRATQAKYAPQNQTQRAKRPSAACGDVLYRQNMPVEITLGVLRSRTPLGRARRPCRPCYMGARLGALGAHSLKLPQPSTSTG